MQTEPVASGPRGKDVLRRNPCRGLTPATALAVSTLWMLATEARSQDVQLNTPNPGDISGVKNLSVVNGNFGDIDTGTLTATYSVEAGSAHVIGGVTVNGNTRFGNDRTDQHEFFGNTTLGLGIGSTATQIGMDSADTLTVNARSTFVAPVTMTGSLTTNGPLTATGQATLGSLEVTGDAEFNGNLIVGGDLHMGGGNIANVGTLNAFTVDTDALEAGTGTFGSIDANSISTNSLTASVATASVGHITNLNTSTIVNSGNITTDTLTTTGKATLNSLEVVNDAEVKGSLTVANGATVSKSFTVAPGSTVDMGGNRVENVGDPIALTDAANKGYVDAGLARAFRDIDRNTEGVALAMAMAGTPTLLPMENFALTANWGQFNLAKLPKLLAA